MLSLPSTSSAAATPQPQREGGACDDLGDPSAATSAGGATCGTGSGDGRADAAAAAAAAAPITADDSYKIRAATTADEPRRRLELEVTVGADGSIRLDDADDDMTKKACRGDQCPPNTDDTPSTSNAAAAPLDVEASESLLPHDVEDADDDDDNEQPTRDDSLRNEEYLDDDKDEEPPPDGDEDNYEQGNYDDDDDEEADWDVDELGPYQDRDRHDYDAFVEVVRTNRAYRSEFMSNRTRSGPDNDESVEGEPLECENEQTMCTSWAILGECQVNPTFMKLKCPVACHTCDWLNATERCRPDPNAIDAFGPGDLDRTLERIVTDPDLVQRYGIEVISRPRAKPTTSDHHDDDIEDNDMWLIVFHNFLSKDEADHIIRLGEKTGYEASQVFVRLHQGQAVSSNSQARTSWNTWCSNECSKDPTHRAMVKRASNILQLNESNFEDTQLLRYESGQYYKRHNDFIDQHLTLPMGPRILTLYVHLSDDVAGGGTRFPVLNATVLPKAGRAVLWPSILNDRPRTMDPRSDHEALPVLPDSPNTKYGANIWVHQGDFKAAFDRACA